MTAKTEDGNEIYSEYKTYMPIPQRLGRSETMGRAPYEKAGLIEETGLPPRRTVTERFVFPVPPEEADDDNAPAVKASGDIEVSVKLVYLPFGKMDASSVVWREVVRKIPLSTLE